MSSKINKIMFVCHGNICRSPMAEFIMKEIVKINHKENNYIIDSSATSTEEIGNDIYYLAKKEMDKNNIPYERHLARRFTTNDYHIYDYIIVMDDNNLYNIKRIIRYDNLNDIRKIYKLKHFINESSDVCDPWYSRDFDLAFNEIYLCCMNLFKFIEEQ